VTTQANECSGHGREIVDVDQSADCARHGWGGHFLAFTEANRGNLLFSLRHFISDAGQAQAQAWPGCLRSARRSASVLPRRLPTICRGIRT
jgi:hypothetical protein